VNAKRIYRLYREEGLIVRTKQRRIDSLKITLSGDRCLIKNHTSCSRRQRTTGGKDEAKDESEFT